MIKMEIIIKGSKVEVRTENGSYRGEYYYKNDKMYLKANNRYDLSMLMKYKKEISEAL